MARDKKTMIGFDPLAWLEDDAEDSQEDNNSESSVN